MSSGSISSPGAPRYRSDNIGAWVEIRARSEHERTAVVLGDDRVTYGELERRIAQVAGALAAAGVAPGDRVAVALKNRVEFLELLFGVARRGAIFVPLNFRLSSDEVGYALSDSGARIVVAQRDTEEAVTAAVAEAGAEVQVILVDGPDARYAAWRDAAPRGAAEPVDPQTPVSIVYTSGTTGPPKGAVLTHGSVAANVTNYLVDWDLHRDDVTLVVNPIFHVVLYIATVPLLFKGGKVVLMEDFDAGGALELVERERVTVWFGIPTAWQMIIDHPSFAATDLSSLRFIGSGGAACPGPLMDRFAELGLAYRQGYGLTESTSSGTSMLPEEQAGHRGSIGRPFFGVEVRIVDDEGRDVEPGASGELLLRGRNICAGYWRKPDETARVFEPDGWFHTGDIARADDEGFLYIVDRKKDLIISGGENIASIEVEQAVLQHPAVREAAVIGVPHERWGETPLAIVAVRPGAALEPAELIAHCRDAIAHYKCPTRVEILDDLPKTANGKISKSELRTRFGGAIATSVPTP